MSKKKPMDLDKDLNSSIRILKIKIIFFSWLAGISLLVAIASFWLYSSSFWFLYEYFPINTHDYANNISAVLASLSGVLFVYIAFLGQRWQMLYQQQEIRDNRKEMKASTAELKIQAKALKKQIKKMDRDFVHQNFFRILDQHFNIRDRIKFSYSLEPVSINSSNTVGRGEDGFVAFFRKLVLWVDDESGWEQKKDDFEEHLFFIENGYQWISKRKDIKKLGDPENWKFNEFEFTDNPNYEEIKFLIRAVMTESGFGPYLRSCYYLFGYMMRNKLPEYLDAVEAAMNIDERSFLFYQVATRFDTDGKVELRYWLIENRFLANIEPKHLLLPEHIFLLYPEESNPELKK
ncbi:hypothetical protein [Cyclobacterium sp.]|uniref:hypothetical protein n=1 Tax=Cyclobacterium sp. TaxID=1966343 RepID=UPI0019944C43|nr:hypothetical protein [Cyclobacterium sp.]MBD3627579.1 hypothetical protein [Cyclobacterium sp.]